jgi:integrase/recombinase XerD
VIIKEKKRVITVTKFCIMAVYLRKKTLSGGRKSYYLDIWHNEKRHYEFLKLYIVRAKTPIDKKQNERVKELAENIRAKREIDLQALDHDYIPKFKRETDFLAYFEKFKESYQNKDIRLVKGALKYFIEFLKESEIKYLPVKSLDEQLCKEYKNYLESKVHGETISNYFKKFRSVIQRAVKEKLILNDITEHIKIVKTDGLKKDILTLEEIQSLSKAYCGNEQVKRAFLFSLNTGLRFCDVKELTWKNIEKERINFTQAKTKNRSKTANLTIDLNKTALNMIGTPGKPEEKVFHLPSHTGCNDSLKAWVKKAEIKKHITWHCARHSIAVNLLDNGTDVKTVASVLGHSGLAHVDKYLRVIDERKKQAVNRLPEIQL